MCFSCALNTALWPTELNCGVDSYHYGDVIMLVPQGGYVVWHYSDMIMSAMASQITSLTIVWKCLAQPFIQAQIKENIKAPRHWPLCGEFTGEFHAQMASNAIWWRHHVFTTISRGQGSHNWHISIIIILISKTAFWQPLHRKYFTLSRKSRWPLKDCEMWIAHKRSLWRLMGCCRLKIVWLFHIYINSQFHHWNIS